MRATFAGRQGQVKHPVRVACCRERGVRRGARVQRMRKRVLRQLDPGRGLELDPAAPRKPHVRIERSEVLVPDSGRIEAQEKQEVRPGVVPYPAQHLASGVRRVDERQPVVSGDARVQFAGIEERTAPVRLEQAVIVCFER